MYEEIAKEKIEVLKKRASMSYLPDRVLLDIVTEIEESNARGVKACATRNYQLKTPEDAVSGSELSRAALGNALIIMTGGILPNGEEVSGIMLTKYFSELEKNAKQIHLAKALLETDTYDRVIPPTIGKMLIAYPDSTGDMVSSEGSSLGDSGLGILNGTKISATYYANGVECDKEYGDELDNLISKSGADIKRW